MWCAAVGLVSKDSQDALVFLYLWLYIGRMHRMYYKRDSILFGRICNKNCNNNDDEKEKPCRESWQREVGIRAHCEGWSHLCAYSSLEYIATLHSLIVWKVKIGWKGSSLVDQHWTLFNEAKDHIMTQEKLQFHRTKHAINIDTH